jgi:hypothetical protein
MEISQHFLPGRLASWLDRNMFVYSRIPYRFKSYDEIYHNPHDSVLFDSELHEEIIKRVAETGADAKLIPDKSGGVLKVNFTEKLLSPLLSKLSNFIPEAGIWMNTLRPEWNDANNALVGYGVSMVTRYTPFCRFPVCFLPPPLRSANYLQKWPDFWTVLIKHSSGILDPLPQALRMKAAKCLPIRWA